MKKYLGFLLLLLVPFIVKAENLRFEYATISNGDIYFNGDTFQSRWGNRDDFGLDLRLIFHNSNGTDIGTQVINNNTTTISGPIYDSWIVTNVNKILESDGYNYKEIDIYMEPYNKPDNVDIFSYGDFVYPDGYFHSYLINKYLLYPGDIIRIGVKPENSMCSGGIYYAGECEANSYNCATYFIGKDDNEPYTNHFQLDSSRTNPYYITLTDRASAGLFLVMNEYKGPELSIKCDKHSVKSNETVSCSLYCKASYFNDDLIVNLSSDKMNIFDLDSKYVFEDIGDGNYSFAIMPEFFQPKDIEDDSAYNEYLNGEALLLNFQMSLKDEYEEINDLTVTAVSQKNFKNEKDSSAYYVMNKTNDFVEPEIKGVEVENPKTGVDNTFKQSIFIIVCVILFIVFVLVDKKKVFKKI